MHEQGGPTCHVTHGSRAVGIEPQPSADSALLQPSLAQRSPTAGSGSWSGSGRALEVLERTIAFLDLGGLTAHTHRRGARQAVDGVDHFRTVLRMCAKEHAGRSRNSRAPVISRTSALVGLELSFSSSAHGTEPRVRYVVEGRARRNPPVNVSVCRVVDVPT